MLKKEKARSEKSFILWYNTQSLEGGEMNRHRLALIIRLIIWVLILSQLATIVLMRTVGYGFSEALHEVNGLLIGILLIIYFILDWKWIKKNMFKF